MKTVVVFEEVGKTIKDWTVVVVVVDIFEYKIVVIEE